MGWTKEKKYRLNCQNCGNIFWSSRPDSKFCTHQCTNQAWRKKNKGYWRSYEAKRIKKK